MAEVIKKTELEGGDGGDGGEGSEKTYTQAELDELLQKEGDRRVSEALKKAEKKNADKLKEAEKLAKMNEAEKYEYELKQREAAIIEKEKALALAENKNEASKILAEKGLSLDLVDFVVAEDAEVMNTNIKALEKAFKASVKAEVEKRLGGKAPQKNQNEGETLTKETFAKLSIKQQQELYRENPDLYKSFVAR